MGKKKLILASSSPFRRALLSRLMVPFDVVAPDIDETPLPNEPAIDLVVRLATEKANIVAGRTKDALVIGSDQVAVHGEDGIVGKPTDHDHAVRQLRQASGQTVVLYTGLALVNSNTGHTQSDVVPYTVKFKTLTDDQIESYLLKEKPYGCSGSLRADGLGIALLERFKGDDPTALIGLPLIRLVSMLEAEGMAPI
ncbi:MAG: Maf family nucleotide pyrophosphatase [Arenicellales bacterium]|nr:Maf family nucleotide pyrophosphatase [Arenicellales bacterium]